MVPVCSARRLSGGPMLVAQEIPLIERLLAAPHDGRVLLSVYAILGREPAVYARLLIAAAERTPESAAASHWLTEAARVRQQSERDDVGAFRLLEAAIERDPLNL